MKYTKFDFEQLDDFKIGFDEYGFEPTTLCDEPDKITEYYSNTLNHLIIRIKALYIILNNFEIDIKAYNNATFYISVTMKFSPYKWLCAISKEDYEILKEVLKCQKEQ